jgi:hypothetical protein
MWTDIKETFPDAELHVAYGWDTFLQLARGNPERMEWMRSMVALLKQPGITEYGRIGKEELAKIRKSCGIWAYPTDFQEINCITALDCQSDGVVPVVIALAALEETAKEGILVQGDIKDEETRKTYLKELLNLMGDHKRWKKLSNKCKKFANKYYWNQIADNWIDNFKEPLKMPMVSIITPTIREGFWRIMAENISQQTYSGDIEWIIVDDHKEDRSELAKKYGARYLRGHKTRKCGLVAANNIGWQNAKGELMVWLQDFILIPKDGIEQLVDIYRHNPNSLIAPVDIYYDCKKANRENKEDWWTDKDVLTDETWRNVRVKNQGARFSENPFDFELNYAGIPKHILEELNGWWEFMDDGLGYDNTEICYRALKSGYKLIIDDTNICKCINLWPIIGGLSQNITSRERMLNPPRWIWLKQQMDSGKLPIVRDIKLDESISLPFTVPKEVEDKDCAKWIEVHTPEIIRGWV